MSLASSKRGNCERGMHHPGHFITPRPFLLSSTNLVSLQSVESGITIQEPCFQHQRGWHRDERRCRRLRVAGISASFSYQRELNQVASTGVSTFSIH